MILKRALIDWNVRIFKISFFKEKLRLLEVL